MSKLLWDQSGERTYETGVDHGVLFLPTDGVYDTGVAWNGLTTVTESPSGAEANPTYADNMKYLNLISVEEFGGTIEAYTYPDEWSQCDGSVSPHDGIHVGQQTRKIFGLCYRSRIGNDILADDFAYKLHLVYGAQAAPSEKAYATVNDKPEAIDFSWQFTTTAVPVTGYRPSSLITIVSSDVDPDNLLVLENYLYGTDGTDPSMPLPDDVIAIFAGSITLVTPTTPTFVASTGVITIPTVSGVRYKRADTGGTVTGTVTIGTAGGHLTIEAVPTDDTYAFNSFADDDWAFTRDP